MFQALVYIGFDSLQCMKCVLHTPSFVQMLHDKLLMLHG